MKFYDENGFYSECNAEYDCPECGECMDAPDVEIDINSAYILGVVDGLRTAFESGLSLDQLIIQAEKAYPHPVFLQDNGRGKYELIDTFQDWIKR